MLLFFGEITKTGNYFLTWDLYSEYLVGSSENIYMYIYVYVQKYMYAHTYQGF